MELARVFIFSKISIFSFIKQILEKIEIFEIFVFIFSKFSIISKILKNPGWRRLDLARVFIFSRISNFFLY